MEIWKDVKNYEGLYQVSNYGNLRSLVNKYGHERILVLKLQKSTKGYLQARLYKNGKAKTVKIHTLVAGAFIPNPKNYPMINHKDEDKTNNCVWNLEWCNNSYNQRYGTLPKRKSVLNTNHPSKSKPVKQYSIDGQLIGIYSSQSEAARQTGILQTSISNNCSGKTNKTHNYKFTY